LTETNVTKILIVDDHEFFRGGLRKHLEGVPGLQVVGEVETGEEAVAQAANLHPDVVLMDVQLLGMNGFEATRQLVGRGPRSPRVIVLTTYGEDDYVYEALRVGASGFVLKDVKAQRLVRDIIAVASGRSQAFPDNISQLMAKVSAKKERDAEAVDRIRGLTKREYEVLHLVAQGLGNDEISRKLGVGIYTVKSHVRQVRSKLGVKNRTQAAIKAYEAGIVDPTNVTGPRIFPA
jgi:DNA-binding NarL/FixJ family response regulator